MVKATRHPLGLVEGATENAAVVQALIDNLIERGLDPKVCRLFIIDGAKALSKVIRRTFGAHTPLQRCQIHKARNVIERLPTPLHASVRKALRQAWELDDADKAERLLRNLARRLEQQAPGVAGSILEGLDQLGRSAIGQQNAIALDADAAIELHQAHGREFALRADHDAIGPQEILHG